MTDLARKLERIDAAGPEIGGKAPDVPAVPRRSRKADDPRLNHPIDVTLTSLPRMTGAAWNAIAARNDPPKLFRVGTTPVRITGGRDDTAVKVQELDVDMMTRFSARSAYWHKVRESDGTVEQFPLERVMRDMLTDPEPPLPPLRRIVRAPSFGPDGSLSLVPGYNADSGHYYVDGGLRVTAPPPAPSGADVAAALSLLFGEFLGDFPFVDEAERAHALSLLLNPFVRDLIDGPTPMYLIEAPSAGTGKGLLAHMLMLPALGMPPLLMPPAANEEETRKRITAALLDIPEAILIDNVRDGVDSPSLAAALTATVWTDRVLGRSESRSIPVRTTWIATGNNPSRSREMARRVIRIRLDAATERPEERTGFRHRRIEQWAARQRGELVGAALTLVQAWLAAGRPLGDHVLGSFDAWAQVHGGILDVCGVPGFLANRRSDVTITTSDDGAWAMFVESWWREFRDRVVTAGELFPLLREIPEFPLGAAPSERGQRQSFGRGLSRNRDRIFGGKQLKFTGTIHQAATYRLLDTGEIPL